MVWDAGSLSDISLTRLTQSFVIHLRASAHADNYVRRPVCLSTPADLDAAHLTQSYCDPERLMIESLLI